MKRRPLLIFAFVAAALAAAYFFTRQSESAVTFPIGRDQLQSTIRASFPIKKEDLLYKATLQDPEVLLEEGKNRIGLRLNATVRLIGSGERKGTIALDGELRYDPTKRQFFLDRPDFRDLKFEGVSSGVTDKLRSALSPLLQSDLVKIPLYRLDETDPRQNLVGKVLKSVQVRNGVLETTFGLP